MKQNITLAVDGSLLKKARAFAAQRGTSVSAMLAEELARLIERETTYAQARRRAIARLQSPFHLGGAKRAPRKSLHDRSNVR